MPQKDILIVVGRSRSDLYNCMDSIIGATHDYKIHVYYEGLRDGFIVGNNRLAEKGTAPHIICLNADTIVRPGWDTDMVDFLELNPWCGQVGYHERLAHLDSDKEPVTSEHGGYWPEIAHNYIEGWCFCIRRSTYDKIGLFDEVNLTRAYWEDVDLSCRIKELSLFPHALTKQNVTHLCHRTIQDPQLTDWYKANQAYIKRRWLS